MITVLEILAPIFTAILLGMLARKKNILTEEGNAGLQQFVMNFCLPCVLFNSCLTGQFGVESLAVIAMVAPLILLSSVCSFVLRKKQLPYHNLPMLFSAQETGMLGIPLYMTLFGAGQAYRMGMLDLGQIGISIPVIAILSANTGKNPSAGYVLKQVFRSPLLLMSLLGLTLNLTGAIHVLNAMGIGGILTEVTGFLAQPVSAVILFCVGYSFSMEKGNSRDILKVCGLHFAVFGCFCALIQGALCLVPGTDAGTRWAVLLYCALPGSYLATGLGRTSEERAMAAGVCSILTVVCLAVFCVIAMLAA